MAKGGQKDHSGMNKETYDRHYTEHKYVGGHHGIEGSPNKMIGGMVGALGGVTNPGATSQQTGALATSPPQQMTNVPPAASSLINPFTPQAQQNAQGMFGTQQAMQNAVGATPMFKKNCNKKY